MSVHSDYRGELTPDEREEYERDLRFAYAREEYEQRHPYEDDVPDDCEYQGEDGTCYCDDHCIYQRGKWKDTCGIWKESEEEE